MFITSREKAIIELIIKTSGKHTAFSIATFLNVSVRTIQRDLKAIEKILEQFQLQLVRNTNKGLCIEGKNEQVFRLVQHLASSQPIDQPPQEKKLQLLLSLFQAAESFKIQALAHELGVSITTLSAYLDELAEWLTNFQLVLSRKRGVGVELTGDEVNKRKALANYLLLYFNEELIESLFLLEQGQVENSQILHYLRSDYLLTIERLVNDIVNKRQTRLADSDYIGLVIQICITMQRIMNGFRIEEDEHLDEDIDDEYRQIEEICTCLEEGFPVQFNHRDIHYLSTVLKGSKLHEAGFVSYDSVILGQLIKNIIQSVSTQLHIDLTNDFSLFQGLLAHMLPSLFRLKQNMSLYNPLTEEIKKKYPVLFLAVKNSVEKEFKEFAAFPDEEIAYIVLHFGSALVLKEEQLPIKALVICPTGIGTSKMLASRLKKEIMEIDSVEIKSIKDVQKQKSLNQFDVILSTVRLPFMNNEYIIVNPLLSREDIETIRSFLRKNIEQFTRNKLYTGLSTNEDVSSTKQQPLMDVLQELKDTHTSIEAIIQHFRVVRITIMTDYQQVMKNMLITASKENLITNVENVFETLIDRERKGGLGIPGTGMGLFHCRNPHVDKLIFQIAHLEEPCVIKGMDGNDMYMNSLLLMLAPEELSSREQEMISLLSTSLIENNEAIMIFSSSDEKIIRSKMETIFLDYLYTNVIKE
ncbi:BglG family transcription antiterminator [Heyndrickxia vini]|uniref:BglG family transcription antiterminator n=1 Tax=Heyndrickxia vini TaxID=1476025 RepID=A0ABX7E0N8_9BACI|nr:BglG family transcription antiterminator [Heyndrickxia vini]QQZ08794.1 BglG family transcription antiterminator [Heyndrickxia vini]